MIYYFVSKDFKVFIIKFNRIQKEKSEGEVQIYPITMLPLKDCLTINSNWTFNAHVSNEDKNEGKSDYVMGVIIAKPLKIHILQ